MIAYHYTSGQGLWGILDSEQLHCTNLSFLNDKSEGKYFKQVLNEVLNKSDKYKKTYEKYYTKTFYNNLIKLSNFYISSFSKNPDSLPMWKHYANGNGYNIGIDLKKIAIDNQSRGFSIDLIKIIYKKEKQIKLLEELLKSFELPMDSLFENKDTSDSLPTIEEFRDNTNYELSENVREFNYRLHTLKLKFKNPSFNDEQEVRIAVYPENLNKKIKPMYKISKNGVFLNYLPIELKVEGAIKTITNHPLNNKMHRKGIKHFLKNKKKFKGVKVNYSKIPFREI